MSPCLAVCGDQKAAPLQCWRPEASRLPSASFPYCWLCTVLRGTSPRLNAGLSTSSASRDRDWRFLGLEYPSGATMEVRSEGLSMPGVPQSASGPIVTGTVGVRGSIETGDMGATVAGPGPFPDLSPALPCGRSAFQGIPSLFMEFICGGHRGTGRTSCWVCRTAQGHS